MVTTLAGLLRTVPRPDGCDDLGVPEPEETLASEPYGLTCDVDGADAASALGLLAAVAAGLAMRGHEVAERLVLPGSVGLYVEEQLVARTCREQMQVTAAQVFDSRAHYVPDGCDALLVTPGSAFAAVGRILDEIELRMAAREMSLPVPVDRTAIVRDPPEHECVEDNQGRCHRCGAVLNPGAWAEYIGEDSRHAA